MLKQYRIFFRFYLLGIALAFFFDLSAQESDSKIYAGQDPIQYLLGNYPKEKALVAYKNPGDPRTFFLRKEVLHSFQQLVQAFKKDHPEERQAPFIVSAFRSFQEQKGIWEEKFTGKRKMRVSIKGKSKKEIIDLILEFSSAPGTSRHHWGTDLDLNALENSYFETGGKGEKFYKWMIENASEFGFCQPYSPKQQRAGQGYNEEKWHWSYAPLSNRFQADWVKLYKKNQLHLSGLFLGSEELNDLPFSYVTSINPDCLKIK
ncbi:peptidase M15 [Leptospira perolatii]|uniref:Peptidase M15 n=2 Tax=Leptospira perolatii TaxID=2023191 RepID=A0A2M9ZI96_9LEPT|nr:peptidase M15 [Leptospira perolatii]PJZ71732.1 peptidase M15 [Leptospira perolatii]